MDVLEAITIVHGVAKLAYLLGYTIYNVAKTARYQAGVLERVEEEIKPLQTFVEVVETVQLSIQHRCPKAEESPIIRQMTTNGVLEGLKEQSKGLATQIPKLISSPDLCRTESDKNSVLGFIRRFRVTWRWEAKEVPRIEHVYIGINRLSTSLQLIMSIINFEALHVDRKGRGSGTVAEQSSELQKEIIRLRKDIRELRDQLQPAFDIITSGNPSLRPLPNGQSSAVTLATARAPERSLLNLSTDDDAIGNTSRRPSIASRITSLSFVTAHTHASRSRYSLSTGRASNTSLVTAHSTFFDALDLIAESVLEDWKLPHDVSTSGQAATEEDTGMESHSSTKRNDPAGESSLHLPEFSSAINTFHTLPRLQSAGPGGHTSSEKGSRAKQWKLDLPVPFQSPPFHDLELSFQSLPLP